MFTWDKTVCITARRLCTRPFPKQIARVAALHPRAVILREKDLDEAAYAELLRQTAPICAAEGVPLIAHTYADAALSCGVRRLHLPMEAFLRMSPSARSRFDFIGASAHSVSDACAAEAAGASYVTASHIFPTDCKPGLPPRGLPFLQEVVQSVSIPVVALGGIDETNAESCLAAGADAVAMMSRFMKI